MYRHRRRCPFGYPEVTHVDITWNSLLPYLIKLTDTLEDLGFRYVDNEVIVLKEDADEKRYNKPYEES